MSQNLDQPDQLELLRAKRDALKKLGDDPAFKSCVLALEGQLRSGRIAIFNNPVKSIDGAFESAYKTGELAGIQLSLSMRQLLIDDLSADIEHILDVERDENGPRDSRDG